MAGSGAVGEAGLIGNGSDGAGVAGEPVSAVNLAKPPRELDKDSDEVAGHKIRFVVAADKTVGGTDRDNRVDLVAEVRCPEH